MAKTYLLIAALNGFIAVALGAFGAHGLKQRLSADMLAVYQTGVQYHFYHTFALLAVALLLLHLPLNNISLSNALRWSGILFTVGIVIFSGSLYVLSITGIRWLGAITPLGGVAFLAGWLLLARAAWLWTEAF
ncbi:MAG TPA: DUF423 domain-containing protein [Spongiibacteraceae bacterium]|nr:DUF423 domain-containing protein [Spongiibacteraceae bacterium]